MADDIQANGLRKGTAIIIDGAPFRVLDFEHRTPGNKRAFVQTKLRNLIDGTQREVKFSSTDFVKRAHVEVRECGFLYAEGESAGVFMDNESYEQTTIGGDIYADAKRWLSEGLTLMIELIDDNPIGIRLPKTVEATVAETEAVIKGQTAARSNKPATLENGVTIQVPTFINVGDRIRVDAAEARYVERVK